MFWISIAMVVVVLLLLRFILSISIANGGDVDTSCWYEGPDSRPSTPDEQEEHWYIALVCAVLYVILICSA